MSDSLFSSEFEPADTRYLWRLWFADLLDLATSALLGWGALRALDVDRTPRALVVAGVGVWLVMSLAGGLSGWTLWRGVMGLRLVTDGSAPGPGRGLVRAGLALVDLAISPFLQRRYGDRLQKVQPEAVPAFSKKWQRGLGWQGFWLVLVFASVWFGVMPTRREALGYLRKLDGWRCCHAKTPPSPFKCSSSVSRALSEAEDGDAQALAIVKDCPRAAAEMER
ncbi:hypothetical protein ATI61_12638 [Archangium gephyra]|uniref:RDD domain-containing protein n=1 Tax=Archangium gephyra TaxID=48 RepID=A0AAC8QIV9_9BACT|nr:hypothetical protein [Archangium gephyra]AKJ08249.1 Hypothetical protein AA314_09875 [Archangium gephyra]REG15362.1 hypothetical protein ATI61_12638 [Archangium gephyra]